MGRCYFVNSKTPSLSSNVYLFGFYLSSPGNVTIPLCLNSTTSPDYLVNIGLRLPLSGFTPSYISCFRLPEIWSMGIYGVIDNQVFPTWLSGQLATRLTGVNLIWSFVIEKPGEWRVNLFPSFLWFLDSLTCKKRVFWYVMAFLYKFNNLI